ncbi:MAG TPA: hypothetical protein VK721_07215 [Solirubrobacteraceae bacterium]|jgi:hypothetical protein|nr:hypothetical protein [Solirubrobacteraceae bacterium]
MEAENLPPDTGARRELLRALVRQLDEESEGDSLVLLSNLLCAAWGSVTAQNQ